MDLKKEDFFKAASVFPYEFDGKTGYAKEITFQQQMDIAARYSDKQDEEASADDVSAILSFTLCDAEGNLMFESPEEAIMVFGNQPASKVMQLFDSVRDVIGMNVEAEEKNL